MHFEATFQLVLKSESGASENTRLGTGAGARRSVSPGIQSSLSPSQPKDDGRDRTDVAARTQLRMGQEKPERSEGGRRGNTTYVHEAGRILSRFEPELSHCGRKHGEKLQNKNC